jgi:hypothetical protein
MDASQKMTYTELAKQFDSSQRVERASPPGTPKVAHPESKEAPLVLPSIHVVNRAGFSQFVQQASISLLMQPVPTDC